jgi:hypothetical protein
VVGEQIPAFQARSPHREARYDVGCLYIGVNDVRALDWDPETFEADFAAALSFIDQRCDRTLALTAPLRLGLPSAGAKVPQLNAIIARMAAERGVLLVDLGSFGGRSFVMADRVHPTAFGQIAIAERALAVLERDGLPARVPPASLIRFSTTRAGRLRSDWTYTYRTAKAWARFAALKLRAQARKPAGIKPIKSIDIIDKVKLPGTPPRRSPPPHPRPGTDPEPRLTPPEPIRKRAPVPCCGLNQ